MKVSYDKHYQTENLFGEPYPELIEFFAAYPQKGKVLDLGCGQGRDAIALARLGFEVVGVDHSKVGIEQMNQISQSEKLNLTGLVEDIYAFEKFDGYDFVLIDSMFHFAQKDKEKEVDLINEIFSNIKHGCLLLVCIQDSGNKVKILNETLDLQGPLKRIADMSFTYTFVDDESGHTSKSDYRMIAVEK